ATAHFDGIELGRAEKVVAASLSAGDHAEMRLLDPATLAPVAKVSLPLGTHLGYRLTDDGSHLAISWSTASHPPDLRLIETRTGKASVIREEPRPTLAGIPRIDVSIERVASFDGTRVPVNVYLPPGAQQ